MKKLSILAVSAMVMTGVTFFSCNSGKSVKLNATIDSVSYIIGASYGQGLRMQVKTNPGDPVNMDALIEGFVNAAKGDSIYLGMEMEAGRNFVDGYYQKIQIEMAAQSKVESDRFLAENRTKSGVKTTDSGLQYSVVKEGTGPKPKEEDVIKIHYQGSFLDGEVFQSSFGADPLDTPVSGVFIGLTEGFQLMPVGSRYIFWLPLELGDGNKMMIYEIELLEIVKN